jgi:hypothetical protein
MISSIDTIRREPVLMSSHHVILGVIKPDVLVPKYAAHVTLVYG